MQTTSWLLLSHKHFYTKKRDGCDGHPAFLMYLHTCRLMVARWVPRFQLGEEIVALIVYENEGGEVLNPNFPHSFHANLGELYTFDALDRIQRKYGSRSADASQIETAMLFASVGNGLGTVSFGNHNHRPAVILEFVNVWVHTVGRSWTH